MKSHAFIRENTAKVMYRKKNDGMKIIVSDFSSSSTFSCIVSNDIFRGIYCFGCVKFSQRDEKYVLAQQTFYVITHEK